MERDRAQGMYFKDLAIKYGLTERQVQTHCTRHCDNLQPEQYETPATLEARLSNLVRMAEDNVRQAKETGDTRQSSRALSVSNETLRLAAQCLGALKSLQPNTGPVSSFRDSPEYRGLVSDVLETCGGCEVCRAALVKKFSGH